MDDREAIRLFVADGGIAREWHAVDEVSRMHYRKLARNLDGLMKGDLVLLPDADLLRIHDDIHKIMEERAANQKAAKCRDSVSRLPAAQ